MNDLGRTDDTAGDADRITTVSELPLLQVSDGSDREKPAGLVLRLQGDGFYVDVSRSDGSAIVTLGAFTEEEVVARWRALSRSSGLPLLLRDDDGALHQPYPQLGRVQLGRRSDRRRLAILSGRRPRFLAKRKSSRLPRRPLVHREAEIVSGQAT